jgi:sugar/nucleoside kinase (ribokinase family)
MSVVIVGSLAFDTIHTPFDSREHILGGACTYSAIAASHFTKPMIVGPVGEDFTDKYVNLLVEKGIDTTGIKREKGKSFFWEGQYHLDMNTRDTIKTELNVFEKFDPILPESYKDAPYLFLANIDPPLQSKVLAAMRKVKFSIVDTMNMWIDIKKPELIEVFKKVDCVVLNDSEIRQFTGKANLLQGAREIQKIGPKYVIIKKGEHGASMLGPQGFYFPANSYPVEDVIDPTGAGDSFAGAFIGYIASQDKVNEAVLKKALVYGNATASFTVEGFGTERLAAITRKDIDTRVKAIRKLESF